MCNKYIFNNCNVSISDDGVVSKEEAEGTEEYLVSKDTALVLLSLYNNGFFALTDNNEGEQFGDGVIVSKAYEYMEEDIIVSEDVNGDIILRLKKIQDEDRIPWY